MLFALKRTGQYQVATIPAQGTSVVKNDTNWSREAAVVSSRQPDTRYGEFIIDRARFRHFAPAELHPYHRTFDHLYREWLGRELSLERQGVARHAVPVKAILEAALRGESLFIPVGDPIPVIEMMIEIHPAGVEVMKVMPRYLLRPVRADDWVNACGTRSTAADHGGIESHPHIIMQRVVLGADGCNYRGIRHSFGCDLSLLFSKVKGKPAGSIPAFTAYCHSFGDVDQEEEPNFLYYGKSQRPWQKRWAEHRRAIERGSGLAFHKTFREETRAGRVTYIHHEVVDTAKTRDAIEDVEERLVAGMLSDPYCLNMIPGGKAGLAYMRAHGMIGPGKSSISIEGRNRVLEDWIREHPRTAVPAPWVAERWKTDEAWAASFVCAAEGRLSVDQVREIRHLATAGEGEEDIRIAVGARSRQQVRGVMEGRTYNRVP